ncbi:serine/threonine-protein kinase PknK [Sandaracinus amylolyticus]|uniref:Adenylate cyclase n=1 Tax=Sandaracinus amylolyticus TaxID=927083 RepID=A0A0F6VZF0_9BACT|nr:serine/threonine-protein kinase [Sandaracinus amylolyticus]AKF03371.1 Adenylate cyclase [Sandaracinus amylolyticus]
MQRGETIAGRFVLEDEVAVGGMGRVFRAADRLEGGHVALKVMARLDAEGATRFARESAILARVGHPAIVRYVAHGTIASGEPWLAMEWLEGEDLLAQLGRRRDTRVTKAREDEATVASRSRAAAREEGANERAPRVATLRASLETSEVIVLARRIASALAALHAEGIVHRDVKPSNVFLPGGRVEHAKLLDLGTARTVATPGDVTRTGMIVGTPAYMAPEQARAESALGPGVDVWALGCLLYECLAGISPFAGDHLVAILARIVLEDPVPIAVRRADVPPALASLIGRMLAKDPLDRPRDGAAVLEALDAIDAVHEPLPEIAPPRAIGSGEQRVRSVVLARAAIAASDDTTLRDALARGGAQGDRLAEGSWLVSVPAHLGPTDQATRAARAALLLRDSVPRVAIALTTGRAEGAAHVPIGELVARAASLLESVPGGEIHVDAGTASLLEGRFEQEPAGDAVRLVGARDAEGTRTLMGRPTRTVGRRRELGMLQATWDDCVAEPRARAVLVTAPPGVGKSRLRWELVRAIERKGEPMTLLFAQGDSLSAGSPFVMIAPAIRRAAGIGGGEALELRREKLEALIARTTVDPQIAVFLGELIGAPYDDTHHEALRAARGDPMLLAEQMSAAFVEWLRAETRVAPVLFVVEDLHWGDRPSVRFLDAALRALAESPLFVLALARPEIHDVFPALWSEHALDEIRLEALTRKASIELARDVLGASADDALLETIADRAAGNALYLEEIVRAFAAGEAHEAASVPDTVLGMVQARLDSLGPDARRILRAASVFGEQFWEGGVRALAGETGRGFRTEEWLDELARRELITAQREARIPGEREYRFRHALVRDAAYALLTDQDRALAHRLAGEWLEAAGERDARVLAGHYEIGGARAEAQRWYRRAAELALEGNDLDGTILAAQRAIASGAEGAELGALHALIATARYWQSRYADAADAGRRAASLLAPGTMTWFVACGSALVSMARVGESARFDAMFADVAAAHAEPGAEAAQIVALCRGTFQLIFKGRFDDADATLARIATLVERAPSLDALTRAQVSHVRGVRAAMVGDVGHFLVHLERAVESFERAGDLRNVSLERTTVGWCYAEVGLYERAIEILRASLEHCVHIKAQQAITYAKVNLGYALERVPAHHDEAERVLREAIDETRSVANKRLEGWARGHLASVLRARGDHEGSEREASAACELLVASPGLHAWVLAARARALVSLGRAADALPLAREAMAVLERLGGLLQGESLPPLALVEALDAIGDHDAARAAILDARARIERRTARLPEAAWRVSFVAIDENARTLTRARAE